MNSIKKERIYYLDIIRGLAVFFMVMQHCMLMFEKTAGEASGIIGTTFILLGTAPAAPMFMIIMGIFMMKSKVDNKTFALRGLKIFLLGYFLNLIRFTLPLVVYGEAREGIQLFFSVDILQMAGLFLILVTPFRKLVKEHWFTLPLMLGIILVSPYLWPLANNKVLTDLFWGTSSDVAFPLFPWAIYPLLGMYLSQYITKPTLDKKVKSNMWMAMTTLVVIGFITLEMFPYTDYSRYGLGATFLVIGFALFYLLSVEYLTRRFSWSPEGRMMRLLIDWSLRVTDIYIVSWFLYGWLTPIIGYNEYSDVVSMILGLLVMMGTHLLVKKTKITSFIPKV